MFEDSLLEKRFGGTYRGRAALISFALQIAFIGILVVMPLIFIEALPARELVTFLVAPPPPPPPPPPAAVDTRPIKTVKHKIVSDMLDTGQLRTPTRIPKKVAMIKESAPPPAAVVGGGRCGWRSRRNSRRRLGRCSRGNCAIHAGGTRAASAQTASRPTGSGFTRRDPRFARSSGETSLPGSGAPGTHTGLGGTKGRYCPRRQHTKPATGQRSPAADDCGY